MIDVTINGRRTTVEATATIAQLARQIGVDDDASGIAVAVNDTVVPRRDWSSRLIAEGDTVEIIRAVQGG